MRGGTHNKIMIVGRSRAQVLRDLADKCEENAVDGPVTVVYDAGLNMCTGTMFVLAKADGPIAVELVQPVEVEA